MNAHSELRSLASLFLKLGIIGFGGPAAHIALMREEVVRKRGWMSEAHFLDLVGATNLIPGPNSTELAIHIGYERAGWKGLIAAGVCFILPAVLITGVFAWLYRHYGQLPEVKPFLYGIQPAISVIILSAVYPLARQSLKSWFLGLLGIAVLAGALLGIPEIALLFGAGFLALSVAWINTDNRTGNARQLFFPLFASPGAAAAIAQVTNLQLFWIFLKVGAILYGSGYALFAFLDEELVTTGLLSRRELTDAIAVGQFTPGPVFSSVTFIGYQMNGWSGAAVAITGIFLPAFLFVAFLNPIVKRLRSSRLFAAFLDAVNVASVAVIVAVCYAMGKDAVTDWRTIAILVACAVVVVCFRKINSALLVAGGALTGYLLTLV